MSGFTTIAGTVGKLLSLANKLAGIFHDQQVKQAGIDAQRADSQQETLSNVQKAKDAQNRAVSDASERKRLHGKYKRSS